MISSSLRTANAIALARRRLLSRPSICDFEKRRLLQKYWDAGGAQCSTQAHNRPRGWEYCLNGLGQQNRMLSTTSTLYARQIVQRYKQPPTPRKPPINTKSSSNHDESPPKNPLPKSEKPPIGIYYRPNTKFFLTVSALFCMGITAYVTILWKHYRAETLRNATLSVPEDVSYRYSAIASTFDSDIDGMEYFIGIYRLRKKLIFKARGDVCEVSIGTGRNLEYYDYDFGRRVVGRNDKVYQHFEGVGKVSSFTAVDKSAEMLEIAHEKFGKIFPGVLGVRWVIQDASEPLPPPPKSANERSGHKVGKKYDTIVQTFGICSTPDPVGLLKNLGESLEPDGKILLLEHGRGKYGWINTVLDNLAPGHANRFGCWWNKDIEKIVEESGLEVYKMKRKHFGTTFWFELKARPKPKHEEDTKLEKKEEVNVQKKKTKSWLMW